MTTTKDIPVIDIERLDEPATLAALDEACRDWGFFQVENHGIDTQVLTALAEKMRVFFAMPREQKLTIERTGDNPWGFFDQELTKNTRDWKETFDYGPAEIPETRRSPAHPAVATIRGRIQNRRAGLLSGLRDAGV